MAQAIKNHMMRGTSRNMPTFMQSAKVTTAVLISTASRCLYSSEISRWMFSLDMSCIDNPSLWSFYQLMGAGSMNFVHLIDYSLNMIFASWIAQIGISTLEMSTAWKSEIPSNVISLWTLPGYHHRAL